MAPCTLQQLTDTATEMFMERGFDGFRVADVAEACGVSEKTVFNYFPTKESLVLDRLDATIASLRAALVEPGTALLEAATGVLEDELAAHTSWLASQDDPAQGAAAFQRFRDLIDATPSLRAYENDMTDQLTTIAAQLIAYRAGMTPDDPEPQIAASALDRTLARPTPRHAEIPGRHTPTRQGPPGNRRRRTAGSSAHQHGLNLARAAHSDTRSTAPKRAAPTRIATNSSLGSAPARRPADQRSARRPAINGCVARGDRGQDRAYVRGETTISQDALRGEPASGEKRVAGGGRTDACLRAGAGIRC
jgi:AcrR family transcriptional regulator